MKIYSNKIKSIIWEAEHDFNIWWILIQRINALKINFHQEGEVIFNDSEIDARMKQVIKDERFGEKTLLKEFYETLKELSEDKNCKYFGKDPKKWMKSIFNNKKKFKEEMARRMINIINHSYAGDDDLFPKFITNRSWDNTNIVKYVRTACLDEWEKAYFNKKGKLTSYKNSDYMYIKKQYDTNGNELTSIYKIQGKEVSLEKFQKFIDSKKFNKKEKAQSKQKVQEIEREI